MIKCVNCGANAAVPTEFGLACRECKHAWTFAEEAEQAVYIQTVLRRTPITRTGTADTETAVPDEPDDFAIIDGIGAKTHEKLVAAGILTYVQLANADVEQVCNIVSHASLEDALSWIAQAGQLAALEG